jgi:DNA polymerase III epsilon subunit-like protein
MDPCLIFFDLETAGTNPDRHPIIQIAAIAVDCGLEPLEAFEAKLRFPTRRACKHSLRKNSYHPGVWAMEAQDPEAVVREFSKFLRRHATVPALAANGNQYFLAQLVAHHASFDGPFLESWCRKLGIFLPARRQVLCTLQRAIWYFTENPHELPPKDYKLATLCQHFRVPLHAAAAHEALADVSATVGLYRALRAGQVEAAGQFTA